MKCVLLSLLITFFMGSSVCAFPKISTAEHMQWWRDARYGMFVHWGLSSMYGGEISWSRDRYGAQKYDSLALKFNPSKFDAEAWMRAAKDAGMRYIVFTAKHHDGFCMWDTRSTSHNIMNTPYGRDICRQLADAAHSEGIRLGWYISVRDWRDADCADPLKKSNYVSRLKTEVKELLSNYGKVDLVWFDYDGWTSPADPKEIFDLCKTLQPNVVINNRLEPLTPDESHARVGRYSEYATPEQFVGSYGETPWECCANLARSGQWAYRKNDAPRSIDVMVDQLMHTIGANGNLLLNVGPDSLGQIPAPFVERLKEIGQWTNKFSAAVYGTRGGPLLPTLKYVSTRRGHEFYITTFQGVGSRIEVTPQLASKIKKIEVISSDEGVARLVDDNRKYPYIELNDAIIKAPNTVIKVECNDDISYIETLPPPSSSGSLAYYAKVTASSSMGEDYMHNAAVALDDNPATSWVVGRRDNLDLNNVYGANFYLYDTISIPKIYNTDGWLEVDLVNARTVGRVVVQGRKFYVRSLIERVKLQYQRSGEWITVGDGSFTDPKEWESDWVVSFKPVKASKWRLLIEKGSGYFGVTEFQLFEK